jgi:ribulose-phosphate 3-epimerase
MIQLIPAINTSEKEDFIEKISSLKKDGVHTVQIDITDGKFTQWESWADPEVIQNIKTNMELELHLMVKNPITEIKKWYGVQNVRRIIIQAESFKKIDLKLYTKLLKFEYEVGFALNPNTDLEVLDEILPNLEYVLLLGVKPGKSGQKFKGKVLKKITDLKKKHPHIKIEVDGGVNLKTIPKIIASGADILCVGSAIFNEKASPEKNIELINELIYKTQ